MQTLVIPDHMIKLAKQLPLQKDEDYKIAAYPDRIYIGTHEQVLCFREHLIPESVEPFTFLLPRSLMAVQDPLPMLCVKAEYARFHPWSEATKYASFLRNLVKELDGLTAMGFAVNGAQGDGTQCTFTIGGKARKALDQFIDVIRQPLDDSLTIVRDVVDDKLVYRFDQYTLESYRGMILNWVAEFDVVTPQFMVRPETLKSCKKDFFDKWKGGLNLSYDSLGNLFLYDDKNDTTLNCVPLTQLDAMPEIAMSRRQAGWLHKFKATGFGMRLLAYPKKDNMLNSLCEIYNTQFSIFSNVTAKNLPADFYIS